MSVTERIEANMKAMPVGSKVSQKNAESYSVGTVSRHTKTRIMVQWHTGSIETPYNAQSCEPVGYKGWRPSQIVPYQPWHTAFNNLKSCELQIREETEKLKTSRISTATVRETAQRLIELSETHDHLTAEVKAGQKSEYSPWGV